MLEQDSPDGQGPPGRGGPTRPAAPKGVLGANFNEEPRGMTSALLADLPTKWVRGFVPMPELDTVTAARQPAVKALLSLAGSGHGTVLFLKFPARDAPPPRPGTSAMNRELARVDKVLDAVLGRVDLLVIGNEPFIETRQEDQATLLNPFYQAVAAHVIAERDKRGGDASRTRLYMGALNRLEQRERRTPAVDACPASAPGSVSRPPSSRWFTGGRNAGPTRCPARTPTATEWRRPPPFGRRCGTRRRTPSADNGGGTCSWAATGTPRARAT